MIACSRSANSPLARIFGMIFVTVLAITIFPHRFRYRFRKPRRDLSDQLRWSYVVRANPRDRPNALTHCVNHLRLEFSQKRLLQENCSSQFGRKLTPVTCYSDTARGTTRPDELLKRWGACCSKSLNHSSIDKAVPFFP